MRKVSVNGFIVFMVVCVSTLSISLSYGHGGCHRLDGSCVTHNVARHHCHNFCSDLYIKIGSDKNGETVGKKSSKKMTVAVFPGKSVKTVDIFLYAVPCCCGLVKNKYTLISHIKKAEVVNHQAQFTKYWSGNLHTGRCLACSEYSIYAEYVGYNAEGREVCKKGRYWGGNHRHWFVRIRH